MGHSASLLDKLVERRDRDRRTALSGGVFVGRGGFGCTLSPPLVTVGEEDPVAASESDRLGKVMLKGAAEQEYAIHRRMKTLDPRNQFGVYADTPPERVRRDVALRSAGGAEEIDKCPLLKAWIAAEPAAAPELYQITMSKALGDLDVLQAYVHRPAVYANLVRHMNMLSNLYEGVRRMHEAGMCHLDIKVENVVVFGQSTDVPTNYKFIDFGLARTFDEILKAKPAQALLTDPTTTSLHRIYMQGSA